MGAALMTLGLAAQDHPSNSDGKPFWVSGTMMIGNGGTEAGGTDQFKVSELGFMPSVGYMVTENIGVGINLGLSQSKFTNFDINGNESDVTTTTSNSVGLFGRYYAYHVDDFAFFGQLDVAFGFGKRKYEDKSDANNNFENDLSSFGLGISPGIQYWFSPAWSVTAQVGLLGFGSETEKDGAGNEQKSSGFEASLFPGNALFGLNFHF